MDSEDKISSLVYLPSIEMIVFTKLDSHNSMFLPSTIDFNLLFHLAPSPPPSASTRSPFSDVSRQRSGSTGSVELMDTDSSAVEMWSCAHCTFQNPSILQSCDMCGLPRN